MTHSPKRGFGIIARSDVARSRPELERARWRCEGCNRDDDLRVCAGTVDKMTYAAVLCPECRLRGEFKRVIALRLRRATLPGFKNGDEP